MTAPARLRRGATRRPARRVLALLVLLLGLLGLVGPAAAQPDLPVRRHDGRVTVLAERGLEGTADRLLASTGKRLEAIEADLPGLPRPARIEIRVVDDAADMQAVAPGGRGVPAWAAGVAFPDLGVLIVARNRGGQVLDVGETLAHELAHLALGAAVGDRAPRWLHEGFAYQHSADWSWDRTETLAQMAWSGNVQPLDELERSFPAAELPAQRAYAQSYDFVGFLAKRGRWEDREDDGDRWPFRRFLGQLAAGADLDSAARSAFGRPLEELYQEWRDDLRRRFFLLPAGVFAFLLWALSAVLLVLAWRRRRRQNRERLARWEHEEAEAMARRAEREAALLAQLQLQPVPPAPPHWMN